MSEDRSQESGVGSQKVREVNVEDVGKVETLVYFIGFVRYQPAGEWFQLAWSMDKQKVLEDVVGASLAVEYAVGKVVLPV